MTESYQHSPIGPTSSDEERIFADSNPNLRRILVNSIPKSGTTWLRMMMAALPNYAEFPMNGLTGTRAAEILPVEPGQVFHGHIRSSPELFELLRRREFATVFIYRDLRDIVVSNYFHLSVLNPNRAPPMFWEHTKEELFDVDLIPDWCYSANRYSDIRNWIASEFPCVSYECLKQDTVGELLGVLAGMGLLATSQFCEAVVNRTSFRAISGREEGDEDPASPLRKGVIGDWRNHFSPRNIARFNEKYGALLEEFGYTLDG